MKCLIGRKLNMTQVWDEKGKVVPVTVIEAGPCYITQVKTEPLDGYRSVQLGFGIKKKPTKAMRGHLKALPSLRLLREFKCPADDQSGAELKRGDLFDASIFNKGDKVKIAGISKGKGFQGVVKRHGFHGHPSTHGHKDQERMPGAIGAGGVQHVRKGQRMAGRMGGENVTVRGLEIIMVDKDKNHIVVKGAVPGARGSFLVISAIG